MDELDRLFSLLVAALARETRVAVPFPASDVYERLVPYRSNRSRLNVATHQDYEMAVLRLLAGERSYVQLEPEDVREAMQREISGVNPDPAYFRTFPDAQVMVNGRAAERVLLADRAYAPSSAADGEELLDTTGENPVPVPFAPRASARTAGSRRRASSSAPVVAARWTSVGRIAWRAGALLDSSEGIHSCRHCWRWNRAGGDRGCDSRSRPPRRKARTRAPLGTPALLCRSLPQDQ